MSTQEFLWGHFQGKQLWVSFSAHLLGAGCSEHQNDERIAQNVQNKWAADPVAKGSAVIVSAKDGNVTLKGAVPDAAAQQRIEEIAREEPGAKGVADETALVAIRETGQAVSSPAATPLPPPAQKPKPNPLPSLQVRHLL